MEAFGVSSSLGPEQTAAQTPDFGPQMPLAEKLLAIAIRAQNFTGASGVAVAIQEGDEVVCRASWGTSAPDVGVRLRDQNSFTYQCLRAGIPMRCDDASTDPRVDSEACANLGISSIANAPVRHGDAVLGVIAAFSESPNAFTETHMVVLATLGEVVAKFLKDDLPAGNNEPLALEVDSPPAADVDPLQEITPEAPAPGETAPVEFAATASAPQVSAPQPPVEPAKVQTETSEPVPAVPVLSSLLASARSKLPQGAVEKDPEIKPEAMRPAFEVPAAPGLLSPAEQVIAPPRPVAERPSASPKPFAFSRPAEERPLVPAPDFGVAPGFDWHTVLHRRFLIPVSTAAILVFALVTWTFHSFRSHKVTPPPPAAVEQPVDSPATNTPEPAELTSAAPASSTVMDVSVKSTVVQKPAPVHRQRLEKAPEAAAEQVSVVGTATEVRRPNTIPVAQPKPEAAPAPSLSLVEAPPKLPVLAAAVPPSAVVGPSISHVVPSKLLHSPAPVYPDTAKRLHMTGKVVLSARIGVDGKVKSVTAVSGPAVFQSSAVVAVKSWRYKPATLDGQPIESTAEITLNFSLPR